MLNLRVMVFVNTAYPFRVRIDAELKRAVVGKKKILIHSLEGSIKSEER